MPFHGWPGLVVITGADALLFAGHETVGAWFTPIVWTGYVLLVGALVARLTDARTPCCAPPSSSGPCS